MLISSNPISTVIKLQNNLCAFISSHNKLLIFCFISFLALLISCDPDTINSPSPYSQPDEDRYNQAYEDSIIFNSTRFLGNTNIQIGSINGTGVRNLCDTLVSYDASWSPNKRKIIFVGSNIFGSNEWGIYQVDLKDYKLKRLLPEETHVTYVAFSPNNNFIAYSIYEPGRPESKIKIYNVNNGAVTDASGWINNIINGLSWSPDSRKVLMDDAYVLDVYTKSVSKLFSIPYHQIFLPAWSPDGTKISFSSDNGSSFNIFIHDLTTNETKVLYPQPFSQYSSSWSKDGQQIIFDQRPYGEFANSYLCKINVDGTNFVQITDGTDNNWNACWFK
jgi:Tol biopolymer transport system component